MWSLWSFLDLFKRDLRSFNFISALTIEFLIVVVGEDGRRDWRGDGEIEGMTTATSKVRITIATGRLMSYLVLYQEWEAFSHS